MKFYENGLWQPGHAWHLTTLGNLKTSFGGMRVLLAVPSIPVLRVTASTSAEQAKSYYKTGLSREDYYSQGTELPGRWGGRGAEQLGLTGEVGKEAFYALADNLDPNTGERLTARTKANRTVGYDFTFNAPKSVSVAWAMTGDDRIVAVFRRAVADTMSELEAEAKTRVRTKGRTDAERTTGNLIWAEYTQFTGRPVDGIEDPHLHAHCYTFNATFDQEEDRWKAGQFRDLKRDAPYWEAAFHARLAKGLAEQGYAIERGSKSWELAGFNGKTLAKFSRRTAQIEAKAKELGITDAAAKSELGAKTRAGKDSSRYSGEELRSEWMSRLTDEERDAISSLRSRRSYARQVSVTPKQAMDYALGHTLDTKSVVPEKEVLREALRRGAGDVDVDAVKAQLGRDDILGEDVGGRRMVTTATVLGEETRMLDFARSGRGACARLAPDAELQVDFLNDAQKSAIEHVWASRDRVTAIMGGAGVGKTTLMQEAVRGLEAEGLKVRAFAPSAAASRGVLRAEGFEGATTIAELLQNPKQHESITDGVMVIDEAGLLGSRTMAEVFDLAEKQNARVVLVGDTKQHQSVQRGDAMRLLRDEAGIVPAEVIEVVRQRGNYRDAVQSIAGGDVVEGFNRLDRLDAIEQVSDDTRHERLAADYVAAVGKGKSALVVSPTRKEGEQVTDSIRKRLKVTTGLHRAERQLTRLDDRRLSASQKQDAVQYQVDDVVVFHGNAKNYRRGESIPLHSLKGRPLATVDLPSRGIKKGERFRVVDVGKNVTVEDAAGRRTALPLKDAEKFNVFTEHKLGVSIGEKLRITANGKALDGKAALNNGDLVEVESFTKDGDLQLKGGKVLPAAFGHVHYGYCTTSHSSQGKTVDRVFVAQGSESLVASSAEQFYVSVSRAREQVKVYTDDKRELLEAVKQSGQRLSAIELMQQAKTVEPDQLTRADRLKAWALRNATGAAERLRSTVAGTRKLWQERTNVQQLRPNQGASR